MLQGLSTGVPPKPTRGWAFPPGTSYRGCPHDTWPVPSTRGIARRWQANPSAQLGQAKGPGGNVAVC